MSVTDDLSKSQRAYRWIKERITNQEFTPGYRLVLGTIAAELAISAVPVREALRQLEAEGLVTFERNVGARVAMVDHSRYRSTMQAVSIVESAATALAARALTPDDLRRAHALNEAMREGLLDFDARAFSAQNQEFHHILYSRCPNARLLEIVTVEWARLGHLRDSIFAFVPGRAAEAVREHDAILALLEGRAPLEEIEAAVRRHRTGTLAAYLAREQPVHTLDLPPADPFLP